MRVLASLFGVLLWSIHSIPNMLISALVVYSAKSIGSAARDQFSEQFDHAREFFRPVTQSITGFA